MFSIYDPLYSCGVSCIFPFFISNYIVLSPLTFFPDVSGLRFFQFSFIFSNQQLLVSLIFTVVSFVYISFISAVFFMILFLLLNLGSISSSLSICFRFKLTLFYLIFWGRISINFPLRTACNWSHRFWTIVLSFSFVPR